MVLGAWVLGISVLGTSVLGISVLGISVLGTSVLGTSVLGISVLGFTVVGSYAVVKPIDPVEAVASCEVSKHEEDALFSGTATLYVIMAAL